MTDKENEIKTLHNMDIHDAMAIESTVIHGQKHIKRAMVVTRVPTGWIYTTENGQSVFVPLTTYRFQF